MYLNRDEYLITTLAEYQTVFWAGIAQQLKQQGAAVSLISFDDNSTEMLRAKGFQVYSASDHDWASNPGPEAIETRLRQYGVSDTPFWYSHEKANFGQWDDAVLDHRLYVYLGLCERALADAVARGRKPILIQELGGFLSVIAAFFVARERGVDNWFVEPAFFKGRSFWLKNTFAAARLSTTSPDQIEPEAVAYLDAAIRQRTIVIPTKDKHHYSSPLKKVVNIGNLRRLVEKLIDKYIKGKRQEFGHVWSHVHRHVSTIVAAGKLRGAYTELSELDRFIYYPLHVPGDVALTLRSPIYLDQLALIDIISRQTPRGMRLAVKEHPAMIGAVGAEPLRALLRRRRNVALLPPSLNNYDVMVKSEAVVSVNSKSGAEALLLGKPVVVLGDAFYRDSGLTRDIESPAQVGSALRDALNGAVPTSDEIADRRHAQQAFFSAVWRESFPGELYVNDAANLTAFTAALCKATT